MSKNLPANKANKMSKGVAQKVKNTLTFQRLEHYRLLVYKMAEDAFAEENIPEIPLQPLKGRPGRYRTVKQLNDDVKQFFLWCGDNGALPTISALSLHLGWYCKAEI